ncbi:MAG: SDR family NAD(P)-dependent oxidoreductase [Coriobacteriales bacterium]|jgi:NAD(P)-dependent dehydrogenase (short-subunit alcohol dehydrogenase family)
MKTWLITGCTSGIGLGILHAVLATGENVVAGVRHPEALDSLTAKYPDTLAIVKLDVTDDAQRRNAVKSAQERFGQVDVLVNNAGYGYRAAVEESDREQVDHLFETNLFGPAALMNLILPEMRKRRDGTIVNVTSMGAVRAAVGNAYYSATKAALEMVSDGLRKELVDLGVRVLMVEPGAFRTGFYDALEGSAEHISDYDSTVDAWRVGPGIEQRHDQPGDPEAAGRVIVETVAKDEMPERLVLSRSAVDVLRTEYQKRLEELDTWEDASISADYE